MRVLVTGGEGFIGRHAVAALRARGVAVATHRDNALGRRADLLDAGDRRALIAAERPTHLLHLAWVTEHGRFWHSPLNADWEAASADLFARFLGAGGVRAVGCGSCTEYGWGGDTECLREDSPLAPHTPYGEAKLRTWERLAALGENTAWGRPFFMFGPGETPTRLLPLMVRAAASGVALDCGPGGTRRDFWDTRNVGAAFAALLLSGVTGPVNIARGVAERFDAIGAAIEAHFGVSDVIRFGRRELGPGEPAVLGADVTRLRREVGFEEPVTFADSLCDLCDGYLGA